MTPTTLTALRTVIKYIKKEYKPCKSFSHSCPNCWTSYALSVLEDLVDLEKWKKKKPSFNKKEMANLKKMIKGIKE